MQWLIDFTKAEAAGANMKPPPESLRYLWNWFTVLRAAHGPEPVKPSEIESWARINRVDLEPFEASTLIQMDIVFRANLPKKK